MSGIVLFGGGGQIGTAIRDASAAEVVSPLHSDFDIVTGDIEVLFARARPDVVINCAAFHNVDRCESDPSSAFATNAIAVDRLARACAQREIRFVTISTDYVFSGTAERPYRESDRPEPRTAYGASKVAGEFLALRHGPSVTIVRTSGVFGTTGNSSKGYTLVERVLGQAERGEPTRMVDDVTFSPTYAPHLARAILDLINRDASGIHHVTNTGSCTWYEYVRRAFDKAGHRDAELVHASYASLGNPTQRPMYSPLENTTFQALGIDPLPSWDEALDAFLVARSARLASRG